LIRHQPLSPFVKTPPEIEKMRIAGRLAAEVLEMIEPHVVPGITTLELDALCHDYIVNHQKAVPACLGYRSPNHPKPFPNSICTSPNRVICHGIPNQEKLKSGDILNIDVTVIKDGYHGDTSKMYLVGDCSILAKRLVRVTQECLYLGIKQVKPGAKLGDIGAIIQTHAESHRYSVVREYCGHGIGNVFHEEGFQILHYGKAGTGMELQPGMTFTIEPMINAGKKDIKPSPDHDWPVYTKDRSLSAQWEHTLLVTDAGFEILTMRLEEKLYFS
jgi:methionyl aminopeptidase